MVFRPLDKIMSVGDRKYEAQNPAPTLSRSLADKVLLATPGTATCQLGALRL